jgi:hypothetical protein
MFLCMETYGLTDVRDVRIEPSHELSDLLGTVLLVLRPTYQ